MLAQLKVKLASAEADVAELRAKVIKAELAEAEAEAVALRERLSLALEAAPSSRGTHHAAPPPASRHLSTQDAALTHVMRTANASWCSRTLPRGQTHTYNQKWWLAPLLREALPFVYSALREQGMGLEQSNADVYQFGVASGGSMKFLRKNVFSTARLWGFDTFSGLPSYPNETQVKMWTAGRFAPMGVRRDESTANEGAELVRRWLDRELPREGASANDIELVVGHYDKSLVASLAVTRGMRPALYVDVDCDWYGATRTALHWMLRSGLIVPGTLIGYDDWWTTACAVHRGALSAASSSSPHTSSPAPGRQISSS